MSSAIEMSEDLFEEIRRAKRENYEKIYSKGGIEGDSEVELREAFESSTTVATGSKLVVTSPRTSLSAYFAHRAAAPPADRCPYALAE